jgi:hypothetical protein
VTKKAIAGAPDARPETSRPASRDSPPRSGTPWPPTPNVPPKTRCHSVNGGVDGT